MLSYKDIKDIESLNRVAASWLASTSTAEKEKLENGYADCDLKKRKVVWTVNNFKGKQTRTLEVCLSYD